jgi:hypothetical protein
LSGSPIKRSAALQLDLSYGMANLKRLKTQEIPITDSIITPTVGIDITHVTNASDIIMVITVIAVSSVMATVASLVMDKKSRSVISTSHLLKM